MRKKDAWGDEKRQTYSYIPSIKIAAEDETTVHEYIMM